MAKTNRCVVRNDGHRAGKFSICERHNERKNEHYFNPNVVPELSPLNVHFKKCEGTYEQEFSSMVEDGTISLRGLGKDPKVFDELVFDVNTDYFDQNGGYEYAKKFYEEAYRCAVGLIGGEEYVLSAVMHADERNKALSEQLGRDVYHYHLHVVYVPVVEKKVYFRKDNKDPELAGKLKEVITQVSHSKKWPRSKQIDEKGEIKRNEDGKAILVNSYSLLQDCFFEHMRAAGFTDFERGERGSTAEHLSVLDYQIQQDRERLSVLGEQSDALDRQLAAKQQRVAGLDKDIAVKTQAAVMFGEIDGMAKRKMSGKVELALEDWREVSSLAKKGVASKVDIAALKQKLAAADKDKEIYRERSKDTEKYRKARLIDPQGAEAAVDAVLQQARADRSVSHQQERKRTGPEL